MTTEPDAAELAVRDRLIELVDGPPVVPPKPADVVPAAPSPLSRRAEKDWWDAVYKDDQADRDTFTGNTPTPPAGPQPEDVPAEADEDGEPVGDADPQEQPEPNAWQRHRKTRLQKPGGEQSSRPVPGAARTAWDTRPPAPRQSLTEAWDRVPYRLKWLAYHASAAYLGWSVGLVDWATHVTDWIAGNGTTSPQAFFWYATAAGTALVYRRTRTWWRPVAWLAAVPATSTVVGVLLYAPHP